MPTKNVKKASQKIRGTVMKKTVGPKLDPEIEKLDTARDTVAIPILKELGQKGAKAKAALLKGATQLERPRVRKWSLQGLGYFTGDKVEATLLSALEEPAMTVRYHALCGISIHGGDFANEKLVQLLKDESGGIRGSALSILGRKKARQYSKQIKACLKDEKNYIRKQAQKILTEWENA